MPSAYRLLNSLTEDKPLSTLAITVNEPQEYMYKQYLSALITIVNAAFAPVGWYVLMNRVNKTFVHNTNIFFFFF